MRALLLTSTQSPPTGGRRMLIGACRKAWMGAAYHFAPRIGRARHAASREALSAYKPACADQSAAEAGGTRDRRRNQCPTSGDEQARRSAEGGHRRGREHQRDRHLLEQKWGSCAEVGKHAKNYGYTRPYWYMPQPTTSRYRELPFKNHSFITLSHFTPNFIMRADTIPLSIYSCL